MDPRLTKLHPFTCYFCNKLIENDTEYGHISSCGLVLEPCINKCGSYVPRNMKNRHMKECKNSKTKSTMKLSFDDSHDLRNSTNTNSLGRPRLKSDTSNSLLKLNLSDLFNKYQNLEHICKELSQSVFALRTQFHEGTQLQNHLQMQMQIQFEKIYYQNEIVSEWKRSVGMQIETLKHDIKLHQIFQNESIIRLGNLEIISKENQGDFSSIKKHFSEEQVKNSQAVNEFEKKLNDFTENFDKENVLIGELWKDNKVDIDRLVQDTFIINENLKEHKAKNSSLVFDVRTVSQISAETSDKLEIQERVVGNIKKELQQFKMDLENLEEFYSNDLLKNGGNVGRLLWKIPDFSSKLKSAKEHDTLLKSPVFYTHNYGYKVKLQIFLNGIKKWKGRHMIACLHVLKGEYDLLLKWPCCIEGTIILRDLHNFTRPADFSKYISAKRHCGDEDTEEPQESSTQYIFVPHTTLFKNHFVKEDTMFIEIRINSLNKIRDETEL